MEEIILKKFSTICERCHRVINKGETCFKRKKRTVTPNETFYKCKECYGKTKGFKRARERRIELVIDGLGTIKTLENRNGRVFIKK
jgi:RNase P subunit RPR2